MKKIYKITIKNCIPPETKDVEVKKEGLVCGNPVFVAKYHNMYKVYDTYSGMIMSPVLSTTIKGAIELEEKDLIQRAGSEEKLKQMFHIAHERCTKVN